MNYISSELLMALTTLDNGVSRMERSSRSWTGSQTPPQCFIELPVSANLEDIFLKKQFFIDYFRPKEIIREDEMGL